MLEEYRQLRASCASEIDSSSLYKMENLKHHIIYEYEFHRGTSAAETARRINYMYGGGVAKENSVRFWFQRFRSGNFDLHNKPRGRPETEIDNAELKAIVESYPLQITSEIAAGCGVSDKTVLIHLKQIGKVKKLERWVPHELNFHGLDRSIGEGENHVVRKCLTVNSHAS
ncbi:hypothetical protein K1T71_012953 [Dendrolimus kikuchii]|uniref:Uncharacterized protein n=1 Tax=Dendrolimus kikuchii TaxID=765133 RepID=A0ACC1CIN5_9NEOP|nr:hypothetical protein K1T71_012953 [Dendrolimus kikuchii]